MLLVYVLSKGWGFIKYAKAWHYLLLLQFTIMLCCRSGMLRIRSMSHHMPKLIILMSIFMDISSNQDKIRLTLLPLKVSK